MRVTNRMTLEMIQRNISRTSERMGDLHTKMSTGKRVNVPSDDPPAAATAMSLRSLMAENEQYVRNIDSAKTWLNATEAAFQNLEDTLTQARVLALRAANTTWSQDQLQNMAHQVDQLLQQALQVGNSSLGGDYLFSGFQVKTAPFTYNAGSTDPGPPPVVTPASVTYNGDDGSMTRALGRDASMPVNTPGSSIFPEVFQTLIDLRDMLAQGDNSALPLDELSQNLEAVSAAHSEIGAKVNRLSDTEKRYSAVHANLAGTLSRAEGLDYAEAITDLTAQETAYKAALAAAARISQISLLDYLS